MTFLTVSVMIMSKLVAIKNYYNYIPKHIALVKLFTNGNNSNEIKWYKYVYSKLRMYIQERQYLSDYLICKKTIKAISVHYETSERTIYRKLNEEANDVYYLVELAEKIADVLYKFTPLNKEVML